MMNWGDYFYYDESSPSCLRHAKDSYSGRGYGKLECAKGSIAGWVHTDGYWNVSFQRRHVSVHRIIWELHGNVFPDGDFDIDHEDGDQRNNRLSNLRCTETKFNTRNRRKLVNNVSGVTGVSFWNRGAGVWAAQWRSLEGKNIQKTFPVAKHGYERAFGLAVKAREAAIQGMNTNGAGYTERHGK